MSGDGEASGPARGCLVGVPLGLAGWGVIAVVVCVACSDGGDPPPRPATPTSAPAPSTPRERDLLEQALDRAWDEHELGCALPTSIVTDTLAPVVEATVETDHLTAVLAAQQYRRERCPA